MKSCTTDLGNGCSTAQPSQLHELVHAELVLLKQLLVHGLSLLLAEHTLCSRARSRGRHSAPRPAQQGEPSARAPGRSPAYLKYFTSALAMTSGSPRPPELSRCGPHQGGPTRQALAWDLTRGRRDPATSSPNPNRDHSRDIQLAGRALGPARRPGACAALCPAPERPGRDHSPEAP